MNPGENTCASGAYALCRVHSRQKRGRGMDSGPASVLPGQEHASKGGSDVSDSDESSLSLSDADIASAVAVIAQLANEIKPHLATFRSARCRALRKALRPLLVDMNSRERGAEARSEVGLTPVNPP